MNIMGMILGNNFSKKLAEHQLNGGMRTLLSSLLHTQNRLEGLLSLSEKVMSKSELSSSAMYACISKLEDQLSDAFKVLTNELNKED